MNIYDVAELTEVMATYWLTLDGWSANESTYLLLAIDPLKLETAVGFNGGKLEVNLPNQFDALEKMVSTAFKTGVVKSPLAAPKDVIAWAMKKKLRLPATLIPVDMVVKDESEVIKDYSVPSKMAREGVRTTLDLPTFNMPARPTDVPQWLRDLPTYATVQFVNNVGGRSMHGPVEAKGVIEIVEDVVTRQATGFFTLNEAAQVLADSRPNLKVLRMKDLMLSAYKDGKLPIRDPSDNGPLSGTRSISASSDLVSVNDINAWLRNDGMGYQFPPAQPRAVELHIAITDYATLATRQQLINAFGAFTGMDMLWFKNLKDIPKLKAARKVAGQGQKGQTVEPWFCPYEVMQWLTDPKRKKGRPLSSDKGWQILEKNFASVYNDYSIGDTREPLEVT